MFPPGMNPNQPAGVPAGGNPTGPTGLGDQIPQPAGDGSIIAGSDVGPTGIGNQIPQAAGDVGSSIPQKAGMNMPRASGGTASDIDSILGDLRE